MGGEGSMASANTTLKNNRNLLSKRKEKNALFGNYVNTEMKDFPEATPELKQRLKKENRRAIVKNMLLFIVLALLVVSFFLYFLF